MNGLMERFGAMADGDRAAFLESVFGTLAKMDPGFSRCAAIWASGKTVRLEARLPWSPAAAAVIHVSVQNGNRGLLETIRRRAADARLEFFPGRLAMDGPDERPAWVASLGVGTLHVHERDGEFVIGAVPRQAVTLPEGLVEGRPFPLKMRDAGDGFRMTLFEGQPIVVAAFAGLRASERAAARSAPIDLALLRASQNLLVVALRAPGLVAGWADVPFALALEPPARRRLVPTSGAGGVIMLAAMDRRTRSVIVIRPLAVSRAWHLELQRLLEEQQDAAEGYDAAACAAEMAEFRRRWPDICTLPSGVPSVVTTASPF